MNTTLQIIELFGTLFNKKKTKSKTLKVLTVSNDAFLQESLQNSLNSQKHYKIQDCASNGKTAQEFLKKNEYDVLICDYNLPLMTGLELTQLAKAVMPSIKSILVYKTENNAKYKTSNLIDAYIHERSAGIKINHIVQKVIEGKRHLDWVNPDDQTSFKNHLSTLNFSNREREILQLIAKNNSTKQIAQLLLIHESTVASYIKNLLIKTGNNNSSNLINYAIAHDLITG